MDPLSRTPNCQPQVFRTKPESNADDFGLIVSKALASTSRTSNGAEQCLTTGVPPFFLTRNSNPNGYGNNDLALGEKPVLNSSQQSHLQSLKALLDDKAGSPNAFVVDDCLAKPGLDWNHLGRSENFSMRLKGAKAEDALLAAGAALANGTPSLYLVESRKELPWFLREADQSYPGLVQVVETAGKVEVDLAAAIRKTSKQPLPARSDSPKSFDNFLGCMMSGLSEQQYAEGRSHLQALNQTLRDRYDSPSNFCEGISVGSTNSFGNPKDSLMADLDAVRSAKNCVFYAYDDQSRPSGMWVELGAAVAWKKPCTLVVPNRQCLPPCLNQDKLPDNLTVVEYRNHKHFLELLATPEGAAKITGQHSTNP